MPQRKEKAKKCTALFQICLHINLQLLLARHIVLIQVSVLIIIFLVIIIILRVVVVVIALIIVII